MRTNMNASPEEFTKSKEEAAEDVASATMKDVIEKLEEMKRKNLKPETNVRVIIETRKVTEKKKPINFVFNENKQRNIEVRYVKKIDDFAVIPNPKIIKEVGKYKIIKLVPDSEEMKILQEDDPIIKIPEDLSCEEKKNMKEERIE
jgi:hypothetical protein